MGMNFRSNLSRERGFTALGAEHKMCEEAGKRLRHIARGIAARQAAKSFATITQADGLGYGILRLWRIQNCQTPGTSGTMPLHIIDPLSSRPSFFSPSDARIREVLF